MPNQIVLNIEDLQQKIETLNTEISERQEEITHIRYILNTYSSTSTASIPLQANKEQSQLSSRQLIENILSENENKKMKAFDIYREFNIRKDIQKSSFYTLLSKYAKNKNTNIKRIDTGIYKLAIDKKNY